MIIKFEDLVNNSKDNFSNIINFFELEIDNDKLNKSIYYNSKEFIMSDLKSEFQGTRFTNPEKKQYIIDEISGDIKKFVDKDDLTLIYNELINI